MFFAMRLDGRKNVLTLSTDRKGRKIDSPYRTDGRTFERSKVLQRSPGRKGRHSHPLVEMLAELTALTENKPHDPTTQFFAADDAMRIAKTNIDLHLHCDPRLCLPAGKHNAERTVG